MDPMLFIVGLVRVAIWAYGSVIAYRRRNAPLAAGFGVAAVNAFVFSVSNAGGFVHQTIFELASVLATPVVAVIIGVYVSAGSGEDKRR